MRHIAKKHNIDINNIKGTGREGRVTKEDVQNYIKTGGSASSQKAESSSSSSSEDEGESSMKRSSIRGAP